MSTAKNIMSITSLRRTIQRMEQLGKPVAGTNSERLKAKRRRQMLAGKLGTAARTVAQEAVAYRWGEEYQETATESTLNYIQGKEFTTNAKPIGTEPTHPASS